MKKAVEYFNLKVNIGFSNLFSLLITRNSDGLILVFIDPAQKVFSVYPKAFIRYLKRDFYKTVKWKSLSDYE